MFIDDLARTLESSIGAQYTIRRGVSQHFAPPEQDHFVTAPTINIRLPTELPAVSDLQSFFMTFGCGSAALWSAAKTSASSALRLLLLQA